MSFLTIGLFSLPTITRADKDLLGARATAMGGGLRADSRGITGLFLNPSGMSLGRSYTISPMYQFRSTDSASHVAIGIVDSVTAQVAAGLYYAYLQGERSRTLAGSKAETPIKETSRTHEVGFASSVPLGQYLTMGTTARYLTHSTSFNDEAPEGVRIGPDVGSFALDIGATIQAASILKIGIVGQNLVSPHESLYPRTLGFGAAVGLGEHLLLAFDTVVDFTSDPDGTTTTFHGGGEILLGGAYVLRGGASRVTFEDATFVSGGVSFLSTKIGLVFGFRQQVDGGSDTLLSAAIELYVQ